MKNVHCTPRTADLDGNHRGIAAFEQEITGWDVYKKLLQYLDGSRIWTMALLCAGVRFLIFCVSHKRWKAWPVRWDFCCLRAIPCCGECL